MENASKALLMAGGMLIAILIVGAFMLMMTNLSEYQRSENVNVKDAQLAEFNKQFTQYTYSDIKGNELMSLINKVIDYNRNYGPTGGKDTPGNTFEYQEIEIKVDFTGFSDKYGVKGTTNLFNRDIFYTANQIESQIKQYREYEQVYTLSVMSELSANYDNLTDKDKTDKEKNELVKEITGKDLSIKETKELIGDIATYRDYSDFKKSTFKNTKEEYNSRTGQIAYLEFKFVK